ncbi:MAG: hypothetical protein OXF86_00350 [Caldilineaceae bacterium]|nr:hypothetical protein [Caldilineaceae bacterium]
MVPTKLSQRYIFDFWYPLALSWLMMSIADPVVSAGITRLPQPELELAAFGVAQPIAILMESPIIYMLGTGVALVRNRAMYQLVWRFMLHLSLLMTLASALLFFTPAYHVMTRTLLGLSEDVATAARPAMQLLLLWPAAIGLRRFLQGVLIRHGYTRHITWGTMFRLATLTVTMAVGVWFGGLPGAALGGLAMVLSVIIEAVVIAWWARPIVRTHIFGRVESPDQSQPDMSYAGMWRFYLPLAATDVMRVISRPLVVAGIARSAMPASSLAAFPVAFGLGMFFSSPMRASHEVVIALLKDERSYKALRRFVVLSGVILSLVMAILVFTPLDRFYFTVLLGVPAEIKPLAVLGAQFMVPITFLMAWQNLYRGRLIKRHDTRSIQFGMAVNLVSMLLALTLGVSVGLASGVVVGTASVTLAYAVEVVVLNTASRPPDTLSDLQPTSAH